MMKRVLAGLLVTFAALSAANAQTLRSAYTDVDFDACTLISAYELGGTFACPGHKGFPVMIAEGDLRMFVSYGFGAPEERAARQGFPQFNMLGPRIEWLLADDPELGEIPVGTILRFLLAAPDYEDSDDQVLVVTRIQAGNTCHVAYIDARANANANQLARDAASRLLGTFDCARRNPEIVGNWRISWSPDR